MTWLLGKDQSEGRMPDRFDKLARYNSERARGIMHTPDWVTEMRALQADFDEWRQRQADPGLKVNVIGPAFPCGPDCAHFSHHE